jgi:hypothetical protein
MDGPDAGSPIAFKEKRKPRREDEGPGAAS